MVYGIDSAEQNHFVCVCTFKFTEPNEKIIIRKFRVRPRTHKTRFCIKNINNENDNNNNRSYAEMN